MVHLTIPLHVKPELNIFKIDLDNYSSVKAQLEECFKTIDYKLKDNSLSLTYVENGVRVFFTATHNLLDEVYSLRETYSDPYFYILFVTKHTGDIHINGRISVEPSDILRLMKRLNYNLTQDDLSQISFFNEPLSVL